MKDDGQGEGFLARWSRRKAGVASAAETAPATASGAAANAAAALPAATAASTAPAAPGARTTAAAPPAPLPTLADVAALTRDSDYARFLAPGVDAEVRNAAMKKLFADPHFNVMDGLDTYIDDYGKPDPLPLSMLRRMHQSKVLGLFDDEVASGAAATPSPPVEANACPDGVASAAVAPSASPEPPPADLPSSAEDDPDLRLQPDDVDRRADAGPGPRG